MQILILIREVISSPALLVGGVTLLGLLLQRKTIDHVIKGTATAIVGFVLLSAGTDFLQNGALKDFGVLFNYDFNIQGVIPNMEAMASLGIAQYAVEVPMVMFWGMVTNIIMARFGPFHYIFLTGHHTLYMASLLTVVLSESGMKKWEVIVCSSLILGLFMAIIPAFAQKEIKKITGGDAIALGHFSTIGYLVAAKVACFLTQKGNKTVEIDDKVEKTKSTEDIPFSSKLSFMRDSTVGIFIVMTSIFFIVTGIAVTRIDLATLDISYKTDGYQNWVIYAIIQGAKFSASIYIILAGVRLTVAEVVPAFKGIAKKIAPNAKPAVDCPILYSYAPNATMIGFLMSFLGGIVTMLVLIGINAWHGSSFIPVIVPGVVAHFFCGGSAGVFANAEGGIKGCIFGAFVHGILISVLALMVMPVLGVLNVSGTSFSDTDFCIAGILFGNLATFLPSNGIFLLCIFSFIIPIFWEQVKKYKK